MQGQGSKGRAIFPNSSILEHARGEQRSRRLALAMLSIACLTADTVVNLKSSAMVGIAHQLGYRSINMPITDH